MSIPLWAIKLGNKAFSFSSKVGSKVKKGSDKIFTSSKTGVNWGARKGSFAKDLAGSVRSEGRGLRRGIKKVPKLAWDHPITTGFLAGSTVNYAILKRKDKKNKKKKV
tara:strand:- start:405 stop:728 length:324 start_codon:yes stop_codon:yes gene_type:complete